MRYFKPTGTLNDISGGTLTSGTVPFDRIVSTQTDTVSGDQTVGVATVTLATIVPSSPAAGDLYMVEIQYNALRAAGSATLTTSFTYTSTLFGLRTVGPAVDLGVGTWPETIVTTESSFSHFILCYIGRIGTWTAFNWRAVSSVASVTVKDGATFKLHKFARG